MPSMTKGYSLQGGTAVKICPAEITEPGTYYAEEGEAFNPVKVDVSGEMEAKEVTITKSGTTTVKPTEGKIGMTSVEVNVDVSGELEAKEIPISQNGTTEVKPSEGKIGMSSVEVSVSVPPYAFYSNSETDTASLAAVDGSTYFGLAFDNADIATTGQCVVTSVEGTLEVETSYGGGVFSVVDGNLQWTVADSVDTTLYRIDSTNAEE